MTAEYGAGHDIAMQGIRDALDDRHIPYELFDTVRQGNLVDKKTAKFYEFVMRKSHLLWSLTYPNAITASEPVKKIYQQLYKEKFAKELEAINPDIIIGNHYINVVVASLYKKQHPNVKIYITITEFSTHRMWVWPGVNTYFVGADDAKHDIDTRHPGENVVVSGIPLRRVFWRLPTKNQAREKLGLPANKTILLFAAGAYNSVPVKPLLESIKEHKNVYAIILAGKKQAAFNMYASFLRQTGMEGKVYGFTDQVPYLMAASDVFISKSGAMSVGEALAAGLPAIYVNNLPGDEEVAARYVSKRGAAINAGTVKKAILALQEVLEDHAKLESMHAQALTLGKPNASIEIVDQILAHH